MMTSVEWWSARGLLCGYGFSGPVFAVQSLQFGRTLVDFVAGEKEKQAGGGGFALIVVAKNLYFSGYKIAMLEQQRAAHRESCLS